VNLIESPDPVDYEFSDNTFEVDEGAPAIIETVKPTQSRAMHDGQFKCLGFDEENFFFIPSKTNKVIKIQRGSMGSKTHLLSIASLEWWLDVFFAKEKPNWEFATDYLMRACERFGIFDADKIRGAGAWFDNGRSVFHMGNRLLVDGELQNIDHFHSRFIYELGRELDSGLSSNPASDEQCHKVINIFQSIKFDRPLSALLAAGWCYLAPVSGSLEWRPHLWLIGARGTGKSWIQNNIIYPLVGNVGLKVASTSTEAGIRQSLLKDARPVIFDEAEAEDISSRKRIQGVIELARQASSAGNAQITKGSASGQAMSFSVRSMFMFGSINPSINAASDESRIAVVALKPHTREVKEVAEFDRFEILVGETLSDDFCASIRARAYRDIPKIRRNAKIMARAVAEKLKSQRSGDQYGALLAGAFGLYSEEELSLDKAREWVKTIDFDDASESESVRDEETLMTTILQSEIRAEVNGLHIVKSLAELIGTLRGDFDLGIPKHEVQNALGRYGFKYESGVLYVSNKHDKISGILRNSAWADNWSRVLVRVDGAQKSTKPLRIGGVVSRFVAVPVDLFL
jgi:putative DNA primase/helicase